MFPIDYERGNPAEPTIAVKHLQRMKTHDTDDQPIELGNENSIIAAAAKPRHLARDKLARDLVSKLEHQRGDGMSIVSVGGTDVRHCDLTSKLTGASPAA